MMNIRRLSAMIFLAAALTATAQRQRTTMTGRLSGSQPAVTVAATVPADTVTTGIDSILRLSGYDKPLAASRETLHARNLSDSLTVTFIKLSVKYLDHAGRELHRREVTLHNTISPGTTELVSFPTWDIQRSFFYIRSVEPRRQATPYDISITVDSIAVAPPATR